MRTENQIKSKLNELTLQKRNIQTRLADLTPETASYTSLNEQLVRIEDMSNMLEWVLNEPLGKYHA
ncbi:hypothetical protein QCD85_00950 [Paenibacillus sp. PsM32]|uniref:Spo0E like sporulation regulatory protein n=1 Tax=Paenibacillus kyungheensis TaxID=1452732 RepID=A0AAX3M818_9BACL|nr:MULTISPECIES: hypothetical protein [Paenibacillus]MDN4616644.1 hypothetical protein [Paenibacillus sp. PsM32]MDQ1233565.1 putative nuclease with TOPRIM domain [Paenibacillus sp. SORGH_AS_0306]MDR6110606.1 putative nuclease with TOPRIM domain [Paenibacillus sp. SORGH_AS_0338]WCT57493.1 hypothetical protein PQ456_08295 [Paenibacillus kyungheensis]WDF49407.1 hypothetical protein PQ460_15485 [Paenibacillus sp. KACC 21273]